MTGTASSPAKASDCRKAEWTSCPSHGTDKIALVEIRQPQENVGEVKRKLLEKRNS
jgi:hypothetical protein